LRTGDVSQCVVSYVPCLLGSEAKASQGNLKNRRVWLRDANLARDRDGVKGLLNPKHPKTPALSIRGAIRDQRKPVATA